MSTELIQVADNFWNIRGSFKIKGLIEIGCGKLMCCSHGQLH